MESFKTSQFVKLPQARQEVEKMTPYSAPLEGRRELLRLDFNENTIGPSPKVIQAIQNIPADQISIYPEYNGLKEAIANHLNSSEIANPIKSNQIGLFNGVDAALHAIFHAYGNRKDAFLTTTPTFGYYHPCACMQGMEIIEIPYEQNSFEFPFNRIYKALIEQNPKLLIICNPNNPTGTNLSAQRIIQLAKASPETLIVIDELYEAFLGDSVIPIVNYEKTPNIVVLRSLSKTYGLAGLRIGFAIGHMAVVNRIQRVTGPYDINSFAVTAAFAALKDQAYIDEYIREVLRAREWIKTKLKEHDVRHVIQSGNYFLLWPKSNVSIVEQSLKKHGVLVRNMNNKPLLEGALRVSIGVSTQMEQFWEAFKKSDEVKALA